MPTPSGLEAFAERDFALKFNSILTHDSSKLVEV